MHNYWLVARHEYLQTVRKRSFMVGILALPLGMIAIFALLVVVELRSENRLPIGYVDQAGFLDVQKQNDLPNAKTRIKVLAYPDQEAALAALKNNEIQAYFVFPSEYLQNFKTEIYYLEKPPSDSNWSDFDDFVRLNLLSKLPQATQLRVIEGPKLTVHDVVSNRDFGEGSVVNIVVPFVASFFFYFATMSAAGYMLRVVSDEKENRTMEIVVTSITPSQLIGGKVIGLMSVVLTQLLIYVSVAVTGMILAAPYIKAIQSAVIPWQYIAIIVLFFLPAYTLIAAMMVTVGAATADIQQGQQLAGMLNLLFLIPMFFLAVLINDPSHPIIVLLTFFPTTSFLTISLRWGLGAIPLWQLALSWSILSGAALGMAWIAVRVFRIGMLHYGQTLNLKALTAALRSE